MKPVTVKPACLAHASFITANMRDADKAEVLCQLPAGIKTYEIASLLLNSGDAFVAYLGDEPVLFFGAHPLNVAMLEVWALGTKKTPRVLQEATRYILNDYMPRAIEAGYRMAECRTHVEHHQAHRWLESTGAVVNGTPFVYGRDGEQFLIYRWDRDYLDRAHKRYRPNHAANDLESV